MPRAECKKALPCVGVRVFLPCSFHVLADARGVAQLEDLIIMLNVILSLRFFFVL